MDIVVWVICLLVMLAGLAGTILPVLPGLPIIWAGFLGYGLYSGWVAYGLGALAVTGFLAVLSLAVDQLAGVMGAKKFGASRAGMIGSFVGAVSGLIIFSLPGLILGTFFGAAAAEMIWEKREVKDSLVSGAGALVGFLAGSLFKFMMGLGFIIYFIWAWIGV
ncbi:MAG: DUF456 domain-containing protein [Candidatus Adiutrix sp.]|jgi:uncharacterized protein YqgC (DUF456 family)|nr:DUF456 domain-containing protein [Candidatus Adiutrix sp.]